MPVDDRRDRPGRDLRWLVVAAIVALPIVVLIVALAQRTWYPTGDQAQAELRMRSLLGQPPLVGAAGRIQDEAMRQGNHPGPLMFWATWPLYVVLGRSAWAFEAATAIVNAVWLTTSVWLVRRRAGWGATAWFGAVALVLIGGFGLDALSQPWNPWVSLLPFAVLLLATWSAIEGDRWAAVLAVAAASYALQGHIGYLPLVVPLAGVAVLAAAWHGWSAPTDDGGRAPGRRAVRAVVPVGAAIGAGLLLWSGPLVDLATRSPSNVSKLIANFSEPSDPPIGLARGLEATFQAANPFGAWVWGGSAVEGSAWPGKLLVLVWAVVAVLVARQGRRPALARLNALLAATLLVGMLAVTRIFGALYLYTFRWIVVIVAMLVFSLGWGLALLLPRPTPAATRRLVALGAVAIVALSLVTSVRVARQDIPYDQSSRSVAGLAPEVAAQLDPAARYQVRWDDPAYLGGIGFGLLLELERRGFDVGGEARFSAAIEPHRVACPGDYDALLTVVTGESRLAEWRAKPEARELAATDPRRDRAGWDRAFAELLAIQRERNGPDYDPADLEAQFNLLLLSGDQPAEVTDLAGELVLGGVPSAVFLQDPPPPDVLDPSDRRNDPCFR
ncbi:MAG TPA: hypothetical protein P5254_03370 [Aquihabitans sp.]|nr:hypothetical protein [Aquihabitans sp.]